MKESLERKKISILVKQLDKLSLIEIDNYIEFFTKYKEERLKKVKK